MFLLLLFSMSKKRSRTTDEIKEEEDVEEKVKELNPGITSQRFKELILPLFKKSKDPNDWSSYPRLYANFLNGMIGVGSIDFQNDAEADTIMVMYDCYQQLYENDSDFREKADPICISFHFPAGPPVGWAASIGAIPATLAPGPVALNGSVQMFQMGNRTLGMQFGRFMQGRHAGQQFWLWNSPAVPFF